MKEGYLIVNKPDGFTSHDIVARIRRQFKMRRVGHAGTLDPLATGVLIILLGRSTKLFERFSSFDKGYLATLILGTSTNSADIEGQIIKQQPYKHITRREVEDAFRRFVGDIKQRPPMFSAVKFKGKKLYQLARQGIEIEREPRNVSVRSLELIEFNPPEIKFTVECSKGTYIRQLAHDIGDLLGCGACISQIQRTKVGSFNIKDAIKVEDVDESHIRHWEN